MSSTGDKHAALGARLEVRGLTKWFYGLRALHNVDFSVEPGELVGLIGPNGSGKTTAIDCITGFQRPDLMHATFDGETVERARPDQLASRGLVRTFQQTRIFPTLSVRRNVEMGGWAARGRDGRKGAVDWDDVARRTEELIELFELGRLADAPAGRLSYGQRKLVEFAAGMQCHPRLVLLDEPVAAVNPTLANSIRRRIVDLNSTGVSVLLVEHNMELVTGICQRLVVLDHGEKIADGPPDEVMAATEVQEAYFGR
jgi:branched-chain amino acid transport system ATP-binding protein